MLISYNTLKSYIAYLPVDSDVDLLSYRLPFEDANRGDCKIRSMLSYGHIFYHITRLVIDRLQKRKNESWDSVRIRLHKKQYGGTVEIYLNGRTTHLDLTDSMGYINFMKLWILYPPEWVGVG